MNKYNKGKIAICRPYFKHLLDRFPKDFKHLIHKFTFGIILINHIEPDGRTAFEHHYNEIIFILF